MDFKQKMIATLNNQSKESITTIAQKYIGAIKKGIDLKRLDERAETVLKDYNYSIPDFVNEIIRIENENFYNSQNKLNNG